MIARFKRVILGIGGGGGGSTEADPYYAAGDFFYPDTNFCVLDTAPSLTNGFS